MLKKSSQFEPQNQIVVACDELQKAMIEAQAAISRVNWLKDRLLSEFESVRAAQDSLEIHTEAEAAAMLKIEVKHLADLRRRYDLPHCSFGNKPRYTKEQLRVICSILEINSKGKAVLKKAA
ncbi:MAG: hypothetical protein ABIU09_02765 [Pyrinomonadaceae bacterium]